MATADRAHLDSFPEGIASPFDAELQNRPEWQLALRIAASKTFSRSAFLPRFLLYVCYQQLTGCGHLINETRIGIDVFQRAGNYNPAEDNVVRNYARILRKRIDDYFQREGAEESIRLTIPRGGYIPFFELPNPPDASPEAAEASAKNANAAPEQSTEIPTASAHSSIRQLLSRFRIPAAFLSGALVCLITVLYFTGKYHQSAPSHVAASQASLPIWPEMFEPNRNTLLVPTDSGLGILENLTHRPITLTEYLNAPPITNERNGKSLINLQTQHYTSLVSLNIILDLSRLRQFNPDRCFVRYPRYLNLRDFRDFNIVLLGSIHANPWDSLFDNQLNFLPTFQSQVNNSYVKNKHPEKSEQAAYRNNSGPNHHTTYGVIDYLPNLNGSGHVLIIQGLSMAGTQAAANVLLQASDVNHWIKPALKPDGSLRPFELLVKCNTLDADAPQGKIIAMRIHNS